MISTIINLKMLEEEEEEVYEYEFMHLKRLQLKSNEKLLASLHQTKVGKPHQSMQYLRFK